jgi:hypothetical protein
MKRILFTLSVVLLVAAGCSSSTTQPTTQVTAPQQQEVAQDPSPSPTQATPTPTKTQPKTYLDLSIQGDAGIIEGSLSYPSEYIPTNMVICAQNQSTQDLYCTTKHLQNNKYLYKVGYKIQVPTGQYIVYSQIPENKDYKAYYNEFVTCGLSTECTSTKVIIVSVKTNDLLTEINPIDWYHQNK